MEHKVISKRAGERYPLIIVECSCGYWQQTRDMAFFPSLWLTSEQHLYWAAQNAAKKVVAR